ncbi:MAG TPA: hypothetical protein VGK34_05715 [Armatimonadota bacterium]
MKQSERQKNDTPRRRWLIIGPGIVFALILALQWVITNRKSSDTGRPIIERQVIAVPKTRGEVRVPEIGFVLQNREQLKLSAAQVSDLRKLEVEWNEKSKPLNDLMNRAASDFQSYMKSAGSKVAMKDIQSHAAPVSELSGQISSLRRVYWEKAIIVLDGKQRRAVEGLFSREVVPKLAGQGGHVNENKGR